MCVGHSYNLGILWDSVIMWCYVCVCGLCVWDILIVEMGMGENSRGARSARGLARAGMAGESGDGRGLGFVTE